jgi:acyl-homoserine-lactone acylase
MGGFGALDVPWGRACRLRVRGADYPGEGGLGDPLGILRFVACAPTPVGWISVAGDTVTFAVEFAQPPTARAITVYGNWSRPGQLHMSDQLELYAQGRARSVLRTRDEIEAHLEERQGPIRQGGSGHPGAVGSQSSGQCPRSGPVRR